MQIKSSTYEEFIAKFTRKACGKHIYGDGYFVSSDFIKRYNIKPTENDMELTPEDYKKLLQLY